MASRNERKRRAKARNAELQRAVAEAWQLDWQRTVERVTPEVNLRTRPSYDVLPKSSNGALVERSGTVVKGKFHSRSRVPSEPLVHDGNKSGRGQLRKRWTK